MGLYWNLQQYSHVKILYDYTTSSAMGSLNFNSVYLLHDTQKDTHIHATSEIIKIQKVLWNITLFWVHEKAENYINLYLPTPKWNDHTQYHRTDM